MWLMPHREQARSYRLYLKGRGAPGFFHLDAGALQAQPTTTHPANNNGHFDPLLANPPLCSRASLGKNQTQVADSSMRTRDNNKPYARPLAIV
ncbi:hypothetical protein CQZ98_22565 [Pseudomonas sp. MYb115]|nr:hypothetical protein CQZ98_22565 [Pseudomonas sp. MYb115]